MKKIISVFTAILVFLSLTITAQNKKNKNTSSSAGDGSKCFGAGTKVINLGVGFLGAGYYRYNRGHGYSYRSSPAFSLSYEQGLPSKLGPGYLGLGAYLGYKTASYRYDNYYYKGDKYFYSHRWTYIFIAARAAYHPEPLIFQKGEVYFGGVLGVRIQTYNYENNSPDPDKDYYRASGGTVYPGYSLFVGGRYYFTNSVGAFAEIGYGISYLTLGLSFKF
jgi:hypothetical protein